MSLISFGIIVDRGCFELRNRKRPQRKDLLVSWGREKSLKDVFL